MSDFSVSVVIPLYNKAPFIRGTLDTVLGQTLAPREIIIVDDGSTDGGPEAIADLVHDRVRLIRQPNAGPGPARNRGAAEASGEWVALIDGDDRWGENHLETLAEVASACPAVAIVASRHERIPVSASLPSPETGEHSIGEFDYFQAACDGEGLFTSATAVKRQLLLDSGGFGAFMPGEDTELWFRLALESALARSTRRTSFYSQQTGGIMDSVSNQMPDTVDQKPMLATIGKALADPEQAPRHDVIRALHRTMAINGVKQELYRGNARVARRIIRECAPLNAKVPISYRLLSLLPPRLLRASVRAAANARNSIASALR